MVGRATASIGLVIGALFMIIIGYSLTLNVYKDYGSYALYYYGRYYGGIACMIVGAGLFFVGILLPFFWPKEKIFRTSEKITSEKDLKLDTSSIDSSYKTTTTTSIIASRIKRISMQSTYSEDALNLLKVLLTLDPNEGFNSLTLSNNSGINLEKVKEIVNLLLNMDLIKKKGTRTREIYYIPSCLKTQILAAINEIG